jgi:hypothetical protein
MKKRIVRRKKKGEVTERDFGVVCWVVVHGAVTSEQAAKWKYAGSLAMARRRLSVLVSHGLLRRERVAGITVYIATNRGTALTGLGLRSPSVSGLAHEARHAISVVTLLETLTETGGDFTSYTTERQIRTDAFRRRLAGEASFGRVPDGILHGPTGDWGLELDRSPKSSVLLRSLLLAYLPRLGTGAEMEAILWVTSTPAVAARYRSVVRELRAEDAIRVVPLAEVAR